jgi:hypothetical protein
MEKIDRDDNQEDNFIVNLKVYDKTFVSMLRYTGKRILGNEAYTFFRGIGDLLMRILWSSTTHHREAW